MSVEHQAIAGLKWGVTAKIATQVVAWSVTILVVRLLQPADYGLMALSAVVLSVFAGIAELGLGASLVQARSLTQHDLARVGGALLLLNLACAGLVAAAAPLFASFYGDPRLELVIQISTVQFLLSAMVAVPEAIAYRDMRFKRLAAADMSSGFVASIVTLLLALSGAGVWSLVIGNLAGHTARTGVLMHRGANALPSFRLRGIGQLVRFGGAWSGARFAWHLSYQADVLIAGRFLTEAAVGTYSVAQQLANLPLQKAMGIVNQVAFPAIARLQEDPSRMRKRMLDAIRLLGVGAVPALWGLGAVSPEFVAVVLGDQWGAVVVPFFVIAIVAPLRMLATLFATALSGVGRPDVELINTLVSLFVIVAALLLGVRWGLVGLAVAYALAVAASFLANFPRTARVIGITALDIGGVMRTSVIAGLAMLAAVAAARFMLAEVAVSLRLPVLVAVGALAYLGVLAAIDRLVWHDAGKVWSALRARS